MSESSLPMMHDDIWSFYLALSFLYLSTRKMFSNSNSYSGFFYFLWFGFIYRVLFDRIDHVSFAVGF